jgi:hypothetical protein
MRAECVPQLGVDWLIVQPDVLHNDPTRGWEPVPAPPESVFIGSEEATRIKLRQEDAATLCTGRGAGPDAVEVESFADDPFRLFARYRDGR